MKKEYKYCILGVWICALLISCSGGGGGSAPPPSVTTSALTKTVALSGGSAGIGYIFDTATHREMMLYRASEMKGAGIITSISFKYYGDLGFAVSCPNVTIKMSHTDQSIFTDTDFNDQINAGQGSQQTVLASSTVNIPAGPDETYYTIPLTTPFNYNGVDNLVVEINRPACDGGIPTPVYNYLGGDNIDLLDTGGGASLTSWLPVTKFTLSGGDNIAVDLNGAGSNNYPFSSDPNGQKVQLLYTSDEINGSGLITGVAFPAGALTSASAYIVNIRMGHTSLASLVDGSAFSSNFNTGIPVTVANAVTFNVPAGVPGDSYIWIPLPDASFNYNGTDNLLVEIEVTNTFGPAAGWKINNTWLPNNRRLYAAAGATTGSADNNYYCIKFRFAGGPVDVVTGAGASDPYPFRDDSGSNGSIRQILYLASELGAKGTITKVGHRLASDSAAASYSTFTVKFVNTNITTLGTTFAANMPGATTVYSGTYTIPDGLKSGDWIEIPLTTPFVIDPTKNFIVQMSNHLGSVTNSTRIDLDATRYLQRRVYAPGDATSDGFAQTHHLADLRLIMQ